MTRVLAAVSLALVCMVVVVGAPAGTRADDEAVALPEVSAPVVEESEDEEPPFKVFNSKDPIHIESDELEVISEGKSRRLIFTNNVRVEQGDVELFAANLEAFYPEGASDPEHLKAQGDVRVLEGDRTIRCRAATYERESGVVVCTGDAIFTQGCDELRGETIEFDTEQERVKVLGGAKVVLQRGEDAERDCKRGGDK